MSAVTLGLLAAVVHAGQGVLSKGLTDRYPARQLIGVLLLTNCLLLLPFAFFVEWHLNAAIVAFHAVSVLIMIVSSLAIWDLFDAGAASSTITAQALSPLAALVGAAVLLPGSVTAVQVVAAVVVVAGVTWALRDAFVGLTRRGTLLRIVITAISVGMLTVVTKLLAEEGVGLVETYVTRTGFAALVMLLAIPPRDIPTAAAPRVLVRSITVTTYFALIILAVQQGSPVVVQTLLAIAPLLNLAWESFRTRSAPAPRALAGAVLVVVGVFLVLGI